MYGSIFRFQPVPGREEDILAESRRWLRERGNTTGCVGEYLLNPDEKAGEWIGIAIFDSEDHYRRNANDPEQDRWYRAFRSMLTSDPVWSDGQIIAIEPASVPL